MNEDTTLPNADEPDKAVPQTLSAGPETPEQAPPQEEPKVSESEADEMATAFLNTLIGKGADASIQNLDQVKTASGRVYTAVAQRGNARLLVNVDLEFGQIPAPPSMATEKVKKVMAAAVVIRTLEAGVAVSQFASAFPIRDGIDGDTGFLRGPKLSVPLCLLGPPDYLRAMWEAQKVTEEIIAYLKQRVGALADAQLSATDEMLTMLAESRLDSMPTGQLFLFGKLV